MEDAQSGLETGYGFLGQRRGLVGKADRGAAEKSQSATEQQLWTAGFRPHHTAFDSLEGALID